MSIRKAIGAVKDRTSIRLAKASSNMAPDLEVAIVKATSHHEVPSDDKHILQVVNLVSSGSSNGYVHSCVAAAALSKRLSKTRDWVVAVKSLLLVHRLLEDADTLFYYEIMHASTKSGRRVLDMSEFRDEAHANSWDHSKFVKTYAVYLEHKLELKMFDTNCGVAVDVGREESWRSSSPASARGLEYGYVGHRKDAVMRRSLSFGDVNECAFNAVTRVPLREMKLDRVFTKMGLLQRLLNRVLACRPTGVAKSCRLVLVAMYPIVKESFQLYANICEVLEILLDKFFNMEYPDCVKAFHVYASAAKQIDELIIFYNWCIDVGVSRTSEIPDVQRINDKVLENLKEFLLNKAKGEGSPQKDAAPATKQEEPQHDMNKSTEKPAPEVDVPPPPSDPQHEPEPLKSQITEDLVNLSDSYATSDSQGSNFELALFTDPPANGNGQWQAFPFDGQSNITPVWQNPAAEAEKTDWELALVESASSFSVQQNSLSGGLDSLLLTGMYDQGTVRQHTSTYPLTHQSESSVTSPRKSSTAALALPALDGSVLAVNEDPFAASLAIPPPSYVQMSDLEKKKQLLTHEQGLWQQYANQGTNQADSLGKMFGQGFYGQPNTPMTPYGMRPGGYY